MALLFPPGPTAGQQYTGPDGTVYEWNGTLSVWVKVNAVQTATAGATAATGAAVIPGGAGTARPTTPATGMFRYNNDTPPAVLEFYDGTTWQSVPTSSGGGLGAATLAQAAAGTSNAVANTPETSVPKNASGMTGSALIPAGSTAQQPAAASYAGAFRYNTDTNLPEFSDGTNWISVAALSTATSVGLGLAVSGTSNNILKLSVPSANIGPTQGTGLAQSIPGSLYYDDEYGAMFMEYNDGTTTQWVQIVGAGAGTTKLIFPPTPGPGATYTGGNGITYTYNSTKGVWYVAGGGGGGGNVQVFSASGTWTKPSSGTTVTAWLWGGGGGGSGGGGGGGGAFVERIIPMSSLGATVTVTIGAGGAAGATAGNGGNTSFGTFSAFGGAGSLASGYGGGGGGSLSAASGTTAGTGTSDLDTGGTGASPLPAPANATGGIWGGGGGAGGGLTAGSSTYGGGGGASATRPRGISLNGGNGGVNGSVGSVPSGGGGGLAAGGAGYAIVFVS